MSKTAFKVGDKVRIPTFQFEGVITEWEVRENPRHNNGMVRVTSDDPFHDGCEYIFWERELEAIPNEPPGPDAS